MSDYFVIYTYIVDYFYTYDLRATVMSASYRKVSKPVAVIFRDPIYTLTRIYDEAPTSSQTRTSWRKFRSEIYNPY